MNKKLVVPKKVPVKSATQGKKGTLLYPIHNHLETEPCMESCPNYRAKHIKTEMITITPTPVWGYTIEWDGWKE